MKNKLYGFTFFILLQLSISAVVANAQCEKNCKWAISEFGKGENLQTIFNKQLAGRYPELTKQQKHVYLTELKNNPDFSHVSFTGEEVEKIRTKLLPVLTLFKRENYSEIGTPARIPQNRAANRSLSRAANRVDGKPSVS